MNRNRQNRGITLVALVVTIIVLLILAGVSIAALSGQNGILTKATEAKQKTERAQANEASLLENIEGIMDSASDVQIPLGFYYVGGSKDTGLVISDKEGDDLANTKQGNQFVWVPVDEINVPYKKWCTGGINYDNDNLVDDIWNDEIISKLQEWYNTDESSTAILENESVKKYKGFYIARFDAGLPNNNDEIVVSNPDSYNTSGKPVSQKNSVVWTNIDYSTAKSNAENMYKNNYVQSILITGTQWDTVMKWLQYSGYNVYDSKEWGNYKDSIGNAAIGSGVKQKSGFSEYWKSNNIYDLAGNTIKWTSEIYLSSYCAIRSNYIGGQANFHPAYRANRVFENLSGNVAFRITLLMR